MNNNNENDNHFNGNNNNNWFVKIELDQIVILFDLLAYDMLLLRLQWFSESVQIIVAKCTNL